MNLLKTLAISIIAISINSCTNTAETPKGEFATGVFIINEGNFSESNGSISHFNKTDESSTQDIFEKANDVSPGGIIQSVYFYENLAFIVDQVGNRIEVVEAETFKSVAVIDQGLSTPRYMVVENGKGYVSNWGAFDASFNLPESYVAVINLSNFSVSNSIKTDNGSEGLFAFGGNVYVANSNSDTIEEIDTSRDSVIGSISVATGPTSFVEDKNGMVWVLSSSFFSGSSLSQINLSTEEVLTSFSISESARSLNINGAGDQLYYLSTPFQADAQVKTMPITATEDGVNAFITTPNLYGMGIDPVTNIIYLGNHNGFQGNGTVIRYEGEKLLDSFATGVAPNGFVFR